MPKKELTTIEVLRIILGGFREEIRSGARKLVDILPEPLKKKWIGRVVGVLAQIVERFDLKGIEEIISDAIEIASDEIGRQLAKSEKKEEVEILKEAKKILEDAKERLKKATDIEAEKNRIIAELQAFADILNVLKMIEERFVPEEEKKEIKIDWNKIFQRIDAAYKIIKKTATEKIIPELEKAYTETKETIKKINQKASDAAQKVKKWPRPF